MDQAACALFCELAADPEVDINMTQMDGFSFLMQLCTYNRGNSFYECLDALLRRDEINFSDVEQNHALHLLCYFNEKRTLQVITRLVQKGINPKIQDAFGYNVLHYFCKALSSSHHQNTWMLDVIRFLLNSGCDVNAQTNDGETALTVLSPKKRIGD